MVSVCLQRGGRAQIQGLAPATPKVTPAATELCPSPNTAFSVSFLRWSFIIFSIFPVWIQPVELFPSSVCVDILLNRSQQLFASCTAKFADGQQCSIPVFDITHQTPLCEEHAKKMVSSGSVFMSLSCCFDWQIAQLQLLLKCVIAFIFDNLVLNPKGWKQFCPIQKNLPFL